MSANGRGQRRPNIDGRPKHVVKQLIALASMCPDETVAKFSSRRQWGRVLAKVINDASRLPLAEDTFAKIFETRLQWVVVAIMRQRGLNASA